jgi:quinol monooxygenase YgiN
MNKYGLYGQLRSTKGNADKLVDILLQASKFLSSVKGCCIYIVSKDRSDKNIVHVTEIWDTKEDHDHSLGLQEIRDLISQALPLLDGNPEKGKELEVFGGKGIYMHDN